MPTRRAWFLRYRLRPDTWLMKSGESSTFELAHDWMSAHAANVARRTLEDVVNSPGAVPWARLEVVEGETSVEE